MAKAYETFELEWQMRRVVVSYQANWLNSGHWHIELRCDERLPVTETGYRSHFLPDPGFRTKSDVAAFVLEWLDHTADTDVWRKYLEDSRQLSLF